MRKWKCIETIYKNDIMVGDIVVTDDKGNGGKWRDGSEMAYPIYKYNLVKFEEIKEFTKSDLKPCMVVRLRNNELWIVAMCKKGICLKNKSEMAGIYQDDIHDDLTVQDDGNLDIIEIYGYSEHACISAEISIEYRELLWKREEKSPQQLKIEFLQAKLDELNANHDKAVEEIKKELDNLK